MCLTFQGGKVGPSRRIVTMVSWRKNRFGVNRQQRALHLSWVVFNCCVVVDRPVDTVLGLDSILAGSCRESDPTSIPTDGRGRVHDAPDRIMTLGHPRGEISVARIRFALRIAAFSDGLIQTSASSATAVMPRSRNRLAEVRCQESVSISLPPGPRRSWGLSRCLPSRWKKGRVDSVQAFPDAVVGGE